MKISTDMAKMQFYFAKALIVCIMSLGVYYVAKSAMHIYL